MTVWRIPESLLKTREHDLAAQKVAWWFIYVLWVGIFAVWFFLPMDGG